METNFSKGELEEKPKSTPKDFFLNLGWLIALYGTVISLLNMLFATIDNVFPDRLSSFVSYNSDNIRNSIAWLIILFPVYVLVTRYIRKSFEADASRKEIWVRRWGVYLTVFLSTVVMIVDVIMLLHNFLSGELSTRFILKVLVTLIVALMVFGYYFYDLKKEGVSRKTGNLFTAISVVLVLASIVWAFTVIGSPFTERQRKFDVQRAGDLQNITYSVANYWQSKGKLPSALTDLTDQIRAYEAPVDPENGQAYEYKATGQKSFELCATFDLPSTAEDMQNNGLYGSLDAWKHDQGRVCFDRNIDSEIYPVKPPSSIAPLPVPVR